MFTVSEYIIYGTTGVCQIVDIRKEKFSVKEKEYYILRPLYDTCSTIYAPTDGDPKKLKKILSQDEIDGLIKPLPEDRLCWIDNDNSRKENYFNIIKDGDRKQLMKLILTMYDHKESLVDSGKKFHYSDEKILKEAEKLLYGEMALVLGVEPEKIQELVFEHYDTQL